MRALVAYLATAGGNDAVALGRRLARSFGGTVDVVMVIPPTDFGGIVRDQAAEWVAAAIDAVPEDLRGEGMVRESDSFATGLLDTAAERDADIIVVGGTGGGLLSSHSLGAVVNDLVHSSPIPVAVASRGIRKSKVETITEVTCAVGDRPGADHLLAAAFRTAKAAQAPLRLLSLITVVPGNPEAARNEALERGRRALDQARSTLRADIPVTAQVAEGTSIETAVDNLSWADGDVMMVGSSRLGAPRRTFLGSTAARILRVLEVPMIVVPKEGADD